MTELVWQIAAAEDWVDPVGIALPGVIDGPCLRHAPNLSDEWARDGALDCLRTTGNAGAVLINDADAAGLAELTYGVTDITDDGLTIVLTFGTGIGSALLCNGDLIANSELGGLLGSLGRFEDVASGRAISDHEFTPDEWAECAQPCFDHIETVLNPIRWVLGGGLSEKFEQYSSRLKLSKPVDVAHLGVHAGIARRHWRASLSLALTEVYLLDEYIGLEPSDHCAFRKFVDRRLVRRTDLRPEAVYSPDPHAPDLDAECNRYEHDVRKARIGLQLLGIGANGHIAFNEPGSAFTSTTRVVRLSEQTRCDNARFFPLGLGPPTTAITQGIDTILAANELLLVACGKHKAVAVSRALEGPATASVPASAIQLHSKVTVIVDPGTASLMQEVPSRV